MPNLFSLASLCVLFLVAPGCYSQSTTQAPPNTFSATGKLGAVIYPSDIPYESSIVQVADPSSTYNGKYTMRIVLFSDTVLNGNFMKNFKVYDNGVYKMTLYDIYMTNSNSGLEGTNFSIVNTNTFFDAGFAVFVAPTYTFKSQAVLVNAKQTNVTQTYASSATANPAVYHEFMDNNYGSNYFTPTTLTKISFTGSGSVSIYAGCVTSNYETTRIATINANNTQDYENLGIKGSCRTYVVSDGTFSYFKMDMAQTDFKNRIGQKGIIMWDNYPYANQGESSMRNALIQSPDIVATNIAVDYQIIFIAEDVNLYLEQDTTGTEKVNKTLTTSDIGTTYQSISTFQQYLLYTVPQNSKGVFIRYSVRESKVSSSLHSFALIMGLMISKFFL